ncbi:MAG: hypothetical protein L6R38_006974 [Xanthoria sp. 2 TBL-2021]|nr:MAG: hypothetical protein L6R38_006974 [Xanthoria sp. 2 TBL-2021]
MYVPVNGLTLQKANSNTEQSSNDVSEEFGLSPTSLLDLPSDFDLDLDLSSLQPEIGRPFEAPDLQPGMDLATMQSHYSSQPFSQEPPQAHVGRSEQDHWAEIPSGFHNTFQGSHMLPSSVSTLLPPYSEAPSNNSRYRSSLPRNMTPKSLDRQSQDEIDAQLTAFDQQQGTAPNTDSENSGTDSYRGQLESRLPQSTHYTIQSSYNTEQQTTNPIVDPVLASWIRKLSNFSVELHLHMLSIPPVEVEPSTWTDSSGKKPDWTQHDQEITVDSTFQLSNQYTEILHDIISRFKSRQAHTRSTTAIGALDQPSQLLLLSSYLCLAESYDKIVQHIKTWTEVRSKMGGPTPVEHLPVKLPSLAVGSFKLSAYSSSQPLVLTCIIEATLMQIREQISEMTKPIHTRNGTTKVSNSPAGEQGNRNDDGLSGVARVTLQAIRTKEDSIMKLIHLVCRLALRCGGP